MLGRKWVLRPVQEAENAEKRKQVKTQVNTVKPCDVSEFMGVLCRHHAFSPDTVIRTWFDESVFILTLHLTVLYCVCGWLSDSLWVIQCCTCLLMSRILRGSHWQTHKCARKVQAGAHSIEIVHIVKLYTPSGGVFKAKTFILKCYEVNSFKYF